MYNILEGIVVVMFIYYLIGKKFKVLRYILYLGLLELLGVILVYFILKLFINEFLFGLIFLFVMGIMFYIFFEELIFILREYGYNILFLYFIFLGICLMLLIYVFM